MTLNLSRLMLSATLTDVLDKLLYADDMANVSQQRGRCQELRGSNRVSQKSKSAPKRLR